MIVKCEKCQSEFNLNETLLKKDGSTVRCSVCKNLFKVFPPAPDVSEDLLEEDLFSDTAMEETVALDMPPEMEGIQDEPMEEDRRDSFDKAFNEAMEEVVEEEDLMVSDDEPMTVGEDTDEPLTNKTERSTFKLRGEKGKGRGRPKVLLISLSVLLFLIVAFLAIFFLFPGILPDSLYSTSSANKESTTDAGVQSLDFEGVNGSFFESDVSGRLYIIEGLVINNDQKPRSYILLKGSILNDQGSPLKQETAYAGNVITDEGLKSTAVEDIKKSMNTKTGKDNNNVDIKPGTSVPFMIIFSDLPENMSEFTLEAVSSSYGK